MGERGTGSGGEAVADTVASGDTVASRDASPAGPAGDPLPEVAPGRYQVGEEVGRGGLGRVLRARDRVLERAVAVKELRATDDGARRRFVREALITARLQHPSIVPIYDAGRWPDRSPFYAMKLVGGKALSEVVAAAAGLDARLALVPTVLAVADAIAYAHAQRIVHRDLKPHNVLVGEFGETIVIDWGLAKDLAGDDRDAPGAGPQREAAGDQTVAGAVLGTPAYMPPEQAAGEEVDERADVYALGALLYHVIAGRAPHEGDSLDVMIARVIAGDVAPLAEVEPRTPADLAAIVAKAMARDKAARYPTARELADDLRRFTTGQLVGAHRYSLGERAWRWLRRHRAIVAVSAAAVALLVGFAAWSFRRIGRERDLAVAKADEARASGELAVENGNLAVLAQARAALDREPAEALAWLRRLDVQGPEWESARTIAADALARPRLDKLITGLPAHELEWVANDRRDLLIGYTSGEVTVVDLQEQTAHTSPVPAASGEQPTWEPCADRKRAIGYGGFSDDHVAYELELATGHVATLPADGDRAIIAMQACTSRWRFLYELGDDRLRWWDERAGKLRTLADHVAGAWETADLEHALSVDAQGFVTWWEPATGRSQPLGRVPGVKQTTAPAMSSDGRVAVFPAAKLMLVQAGRAPLEAKPTLGYVAAVAPDGGETAYADLTRPEQGGVELYGPDAASIGRLDARGRISALYYTQDGHWLIAFGDRVYAWDRETHVRFDLGEDPDAATIATGDVIFRPSRDGTLRVWSLTGSRVRVRYRGAYAGNVSPGGGRVIAVLRDRVVRSLLGNGDPDDELPTSQLAGAPIAVAIGDDGTALVHTTGGLWRWPLRGAPERLAIHVEAGAQLAWTSAGARVVTRKGVFVGGRAVWQTPAGRGAWAASDDLRWIVVDDLDGAKTWVVDRATGREELVPGAIARASTFTAGGGWFATAAKDAGVVVWEVVKNRPIGPTLDVGAAEVRGLAFDETGERLAIATSVDARLCDLRSEGCRVLATGPALQVRFKRDDIVIVRERDTIEVIDDLPSDPAELARRLHDLPFRIEDEKLVMRQ